MRTRSGHPADESQLETLFAQSFTDVWNYVRRRSVSREDADHLTAEVFAAAWRRWADLPVGEDQRAWLFGVARRLLANHRRSSTRYRRLLERLALGRAPATEEPDVADDDLWRSLAALSADDCDLLLMRAWDGLTVGEMATVLGCTPNAVSVRLHKARGRLAAELHRHDVTETSGTGVTREGEPCGRSRA